MAKFITLHDDNGVTIHVNLDLVRLIKPTRSEPTTEVVFSDGEPIYVRESIVDIIAAADNAWGI
jgi:hypothetical protein